MKACEIVERAGKGLANANITMLDRADGLARVTAGLISQGRVLFDAARATSFEDSSHDPTPEVQHVPDLPSVVEPRTSDNEDQSRSE
jgi:hypothetical protein